jgi:hypothetical protein
VKQQESSYIQSVEGSMPCGSQLLTVSKGDGESDTYLLERPNELRVIVQFKSLPLSRISPMTSKKLPVPAIQSALIALQGEHSQFRSDLAMIEGSIRSSTQTQSLRTETKILSEYQTAFNGVAMTTTRSVLKQIQQLPYVTGVGEDRMVKALDDSSNRVIGVPTFWNRTDVHGDSVDIGIIDTGIDYLHPALGGAPFPNNKVVGGWDFVNNDADPMDDHGHGTHVAGIAAGDCNSLRGVAYNAPFDVSFITNEFRLIGYPAIKNIIVDALAIARQVLPGLGKYPQENVARFVGIPFPIKHRAMEDTMVTAQLFSIFTSMLKAHDCTTVADLQRRDLTHVLHNKRKTIVDSALAEKQNLWIKYLSPTNAEITDRIITPKECFTDQIGKNRTSYLVAHCHTANAERNFRLDRILDLRII